ncbi:MAG: hypothetical protein GY794_11685, partial [bacterium]|nr:hypothetical protein [bacterium]
VTFGKAIPQEEARELKSSELIDHLHDTMVEMQTEIRRKKGMPALKYD